MATILGYQGSVLLVAIMLLLAFGLTAALYTATRADNRRTTGEARRSR